LNSAWIPLPLAPAPTPHRQDPVSTRHRDEKNHSSLTAFRATITNPLSLYKVIGHIQHFHLPSSCLLLRCNSGERSVFRILATRPTPRCGNKTSSHAQRRFESTRFPTHSTLICHTGRITHVTPQHTFTSLAVHTWSNQWHCAF
jgi:hypothetical protein